MRALILGGGSLKGAFQVGAIKAVLEDGFEPEMVYGVSVGALNATYLVNAAGRDFIENEKIDWPRLGHDLMSLWIKNIRQPQDVSFLRSRVSMGVNTLLSRYDGLLDPKPLHDLMHRNVDQFILRNSPVRIKVGAVNITNGELVFASPDDEFFMEYVRASSSLPMLMPAVPIGSKTEKFMDGGLRVVAPIHQAIQDGAREIVLIACHAKQLYSRENFNSRNLISLIERVKDITVNQIVNNDIEWAESYAERSVLRGDPIKLTVIRPEEPLLLDLQKFTSDDITRLILDGYRIGLDVLKLAAETTPLKKEKVE
jgi:NTE family protein